METDEIFKNQKRGKFIVFEGLDRSGKTTQSKLLTNRLNSLNQPSQLIRFPDRTTGIGKMIDSYLSQGIELEDHAIHLLFSANRWEKSLSIKESIQDRSENVICDRYSFSGIAFTSAKLRLKNEPEPMNRLSSPDVGLPLPDLIIYLNSNGTEQHRDGFGEERYERRELQNQVNLEFKNQVKRYFEEIHELNRDKEKIWVEVDGTGSIEEVEMRIWNLVQGYLDQESDPVIGKLWISSV